MDSQKEQSESIFGDALYKALQIATDGEMSEATRTEVTAKLIKHLTPEHIADITAILIRSRNEVDSKLTS